MPQKRLSPSGGDRTSATRLANLRPRHLRATVQPFGAEQQHDGLQIHADVGPAAISAVICQSLLLAGSRKRARANVLRLPAKIKSAGLAP